jgi:hypothetical protein
VASVGADDLARVDPLRGDPGVGQERGDDPAAPELPFATRLSTSAGDAWPAAAMAVTAWTAPRARLSTRRRAAAAWTASAHPPPRRDDGP